ncbi:MAG: hypothetical protein OEZ06_29285 [Myxococcales bacterium]|nr:hypothetical protein [Myxococcales bacterium]
MRVSIPLLLLAVLACGHGCTPEQDKAPEPTAPPEPSAEAPAEPAAVEPAPKAPGDKTEVQKLMRGHFAHAAQAREALIRGDIEAAGAAMKWLAEHEKGDALPQTLRPLLQPMQQAAAGFAEVKTLREAGAALATTLTKCGACHQEAKDGPIFAASPMPTGEDARSHMQRHLWVASRMWEGLVLGSGELFAEAAKELESTGVDPAVLTGGAHAAKVKALTEHVHKLAEEAGATGADADADARAHIYGRFLATCATCHRMVGKGPQPAEGFVPEEL